MWLQFRANFAGWYIEMRQNHLSMCTEGIKAFSKRIWRCSVDGRNDTKTITVKTEQNSSVFVWKQISVDRALHTVMTFEWLFISLKVRSGVHVPYTFYLQVSGQLFVSLLHFTFNYLTSHPTEKILWHTETGYLLCMKFIIRWQSYHWQQKCLSSVVCPHVCLCGRFSFQ